MKHSSFRRAGHIKNLENHSSEGVSPAVAPLPGKAIKLRLSTSLNSFSEIEIGTSVQRPDFANIAIISASFKGDQANCTKWIFLT